MTKKNFGTRGKVSAVIIMAAVIFLVMPQIYMAVAPEKATVYAATNLLKGDFETDTNNYWEVWNTDPSRTYELSRSYDSCYGYGSYSAIIHQLGPEGQRFDSGFITKNSNNSFMVEAGKSYTLIFHAKATNWTKVTVFMERSSDFVAISDLAEVDVTQDWNRYVVTFKPSESANALLNFAFGDMPYNTYMNMDGVSLVQNNITLSTAELSGYIGDTNKKLVTSDIKLFAPYDVEIELPYYNSQTGEVGLKKFNPEKVDATGAYINFYEGTYAGIGRIYIAKQLVGEFNYNVKPKITEFYPTMLRADEDVTIMGTGFSPVDNNTFVIVKAMDANGVRYDYWTKPFSMDSSLKQMTIKLPLGVISGNMYVRTSFWNKSGADTFNNSNSLSYRVKPKIFSLEWSTSGYDQVGDKLLIHGKGLINSPAVNFYDANKKKIMKKPAKIKSITDEEVIEVDTPRNMNQMYVTAEAGSVESDLENALYYSAKPRITAISSKYRRALLESKDSISAAKIGDTIEIRGESLTGQTVEVEFQGLNERIRAATSTQLNGTSVKVTVPDGAQNGYLNVIVNNEWSNSLPLEIIPTVMNIDPNPVEPGSEMVIAAQGVGDNVNLAKVVFKMSDNTELAVYPHTIVYQDRMALVYLNAPLSLSNKYTSLNLQYGVWRDDTQYFVNVEPHITSVNFDIDSQMLIIEGYGFSIVPRENEITYKYADENHTIVTPKATVQGVYPTEGGQEIRIKILDDYHYGYVSVKVGDKTSNEMNFGPVYIRKIAKRVEYVKNEGRVMGVLYITGNNFGPTGGVKVGDVWANVHYRSDFFIIAVVEKENVYDNPVIVAKDN